MTFAHRFEHLDGGNAVEAFRDVAIILQAQFHPVLQSSAGDARLTIGELRRREGHAHHRCAIISRRHLGKRPPSAADFQQSHAGAQIDGLTEAMDLGQLGLLQILLGRAEQSR